MANEKGASKGTEQNTGFYKEMWKAKSGWSCFIVSEFCIYMKIWNKSLK